MARTNADTVTPECYPPRARWYGRLYHPLYRLRRSLHLEQIRPSAGISFRQFVLSLVIPGFAFLANDRWILGWAFMGTYCIATVVCIAALGYQIGNFAYGVMISAHATSIVFVEGHWLRDTGFLRRVMLALATLLAVWLLVYAPLSGFVQRHWVMALRVHDQVVIVQSRVSTRDLRYGDWLMYTLDRSTSGEAHGGGAVWVQAGFGWGPMLAVAGDIVKFSTNSFSVNGLPQPLRPHMPTSGELIVPEKRWFVWPDLGITGRGNVNERVIATTILQIAIVSEKQLIGKPFNRWFWRRQILP